MDSLLPFALFLVVWFGLQVLAPAEDGRPHLSRSPAAPVGAA